MTIKTIPTSKLKLGMHLHKLGGSWLNHPFLRSSFLLTDPNAITRIKQAGIKEVLIDTDKGLDVEADPIEVTEEVITEEVATEASEQPIKAKKNLSMDAAIARSQKLCASAKEQVTMMFDDVRMGKSIDTEATKTLIKDIDQIIEANSAAILSVVRLKTHDEYTFMHSVAVSALMMALARKLNFDEDMVELAGFAGMVHDLGKAFMPIDVLNKPGQLTDEEFTVIKKHPIAGAKALKQGNIPDEVIDVVLHHHEKMDGSGYPSGLKGEQISVLSRMGAICDVYDAVTSVRPYKEPWDPTTALRRMASWEGHFDKDIFNAFVASVGIYPVGSLVRLQSQRLAVVTEANYESLIKPTVKIFYSLKFREHITIQSLDLSKEDCDDKIEDVEDPSQWNFGNLTSLWQ